MAVGAVTPKRVAQDGMRVRSVAGAASFRRGESLERYLEAAHTQVQTLKAQREEDLGAVTRRQQAARERAARERQERVGKALERLPELAKLNVKQGKKPETARASTTDAEATVMKMADGGFRPAFNAQLLLAYYPANQREIANYEAGVFCHSLRCRMGGLRESA